MLKTKALVNAVGAFLFYFLCFSFVFLISESIAFSEDILTDDIYIFAETNGIAVAICKAIDMGTYLMTPLFAIMFTIIGYGSFQGNLKWSVFVTFTLGIAAFKGAGSIAVLFMPGMGLEYGCNCAIEREIKNEKGEFVRRPTGLNLDCSEGTEDYHARFD